MRQRTGARMIAAALVCLAICTLSPAAAQAAWTQPTATSLNVDQSQSGFDPSLASVGGVPYVAWDESNGTTYQIYVKRFDGSSWAPVGGSLNVYPAGQSFLPDIASVGGVPYVAWPESNGTTLQVYVRRFDGSAWVAVGGSLNVDPTKGANGATITSVGGVPYVAFSETTGTSEQLYVERFDGSSWVPVGGPLNIDTARSAIGPSITSVGGTPYVAWDESNGTSDQVYVKRWGGASWVQVGGSLNADPSADAIGPSLTSIGGVPYVAYRELNGSASQIHVALLNGSSWAQVGGILNVDPTRAAYDPSISSVGDTPIVDWSEFNGTHFEAYVKQWGGSSWAAVGGSLNVDPNNDAIMTDPPNLGSIGGVPYATWTENNGTGYEVRVKRLEPDISTESAAPSASGATLTAQVNDYGVHLPVAFEYGKTAGFGSQTSLQTTPGTGASTVTQTVSGLTPSTTYFYRAFGTDTFRETSQGATQTFKTLTPVLSSLRVTPSRFSLAGREQKGHCVKPTKRNVHNRSCRRPVRLRISFTLNAATTLALTISRKTTGRKVGGRCVRLSRKNAAHHKCTLFTTLHGKLIINGTAGTNHVTFNGKIGGHTLGPGTYRLLVAAVGGNAGTVIFKLVA